ncbi:MAG: hypothetical protein ACN6QY_19125 [Pseudomonas sp.]|uniref:hypothetical protein n=1 Tax=unclassified Pseudomonas TaxID=196821 RepID=UPI00072FC040|nr:hypothetical protein [Pseudomonas sp. L5B5]KTC37039.1 hypothetical protein AO265_03685 [Pseudomonas sp. ABAC61]UCZ84517.1 hypothetical protein LGQ10_30120 [Pseudomonas sp. L5B5]
MSLKTLGTVSVLTLSMLALAGCEQAEKSAQQVLDKTAQAAKQAIDDTHKAAEQALSDATGGAIGKEKNQDDDAKQAESSQEI